MATEYKLSYTGQEINNKLSKVDEAVRYTSQTLTAAQKAQVRENIGAMGEEAIENLVVTAIVNAGELTNVSETFETIYEAYLAGRNISLHIQSMSGTTTMLPCTSIDTDNAFFDAVTAIAGENSIHSAIIFSDDTSNYTSSLIDGGGVVEETDPTVPSWAKALSKPSYTKSEVGLGNVDNVKQYSESNPPPYPVTKVNGKTGAVTLSASDVGADATGTASSAVSAHNTSTAAHSDIREQINQLSSEKVDKSGMTLGVHTDGFVYLFVNGSPQGNGLEIKADVIEGDVFGYVDENNNIVLNGSLENGTYSVKYEMENGSTVNIGNLVLDTNVYYTVKNTLTNCKNSNSATQVVEGNSYSATITANDGYELKTVTVTMGGSNVSVSGGNISIASVTGNIVITAVAEEVQTSGYTNLADPTSADWQEGYRVSLSSGNTSALAEHTTTNFIPAQVGDILRVKGMRITGSDSTGGDGANSAKICMYNSSKSRMGGGYGLTVVNDDCYGLKVTTNGDISEYTLLMRNTNTQTTLTGAAYIRIDGFLMDGYTKNDVIITINEEITDNETNLLPLAVNADGTPYVGTNGEKGYKTGYKMSVSSGNESATSGAYCSGFIPVTWEDRIRIKNIVRSSQEFVNNIVIYDNNKTKLNGTGGVEGAFAAWIEDSTVDGVLTFRPDGWADTQNAAYFRFSCGGISDETIVTVNEEIV